MRTFAADNGEVSIPVEPQRVVATGYAVPVLLENEAKLVGISTWQRGLPLMSDEVRSDYEELPKVAGETAAETDYEAIAAAEPDLIVIGVPKPVLADVDLDRLGSIAPVVAIGPTVPDAWRTLSERQSDAAGVLDDFGAARTAYEAKSAELRAKYADAVDGLQFGHVGAYGDVAQGTFMREYGRSWGTNIVEDLGLTYYGEPEEKKGGSSDVSEVPSIEELSTSLGEADAITYTVQADGTPSAAVQYVLDSPLWKNLPAVQAGMTFPLRYTEAATYDSAQQTLAAADESLAPLLEP